MACEIVLRNADGRESFRIGERDHGIGELIRIDGRDWRVVAAERSRLPGVDRRLICVATEGDAGPRQGLVEARRSPREFRARPR
jgi:hypothetical protein